MSAAWRPRAMLLLAVLGTGIATYLSWVALDPTRVVACGALGDCHAVQGSQYARVAGGFRSPFSGCSCTSGCLCSRRVELWRGPVPRCRRRWPH
ncbi:MAG: hypothetical protein EXR66_04210 [Dehalococcoidia bacterium]|nr:hypothetical protein [Dehalococcoidia bacterium]